MELSEVVGHIRLSCIQVALRIERRAQLPPYLGSTLRGVLARCTREVVCGLRHPTCDGCLLVERCAYSVLFETPPDSRLPLWQRRTDWPRPYVIRPPAPREKPWLAGEELAFQVLLFGRAAEYAPFLLEAIRQVPGYGLGSGRAKVGVVRVEDAAQSLLGLSGPAVLKLPSLSVVNPMAAAPDFEGWGSVRLDFETPLRILEKGRRVSDLSFQSLIRALIGRVCSVVSFHCGTAASLAEYEDLLEQAGKVLTTGTSLRDQSLHRWSNRQQRRIPLDGLTGSAVFTGPPLRDFLGLLWAGQFTHVGKGTVHGLGQYRVSHA